MAPPSGLRSAIEQHVRPGEPAWQKPYSGGAARAGPGRELQPSTAVRTAAVRSIGAMESPRSATKPYTRSSFHTHTEVGVPVRTGAQMKLAPSRVCWLIDSRLSWKRLLGSTALVVKSLISSCGVSETWLGMV